MSYDPTIWKSGDILSAVKLNKLEKGVEEFSIVDTEMSEESEKPVQNKVIKEYIDSHSGGNTITNLPIGSVIAHMGETAPLGFLVCDGTEYNISQYPKLFDVINNKFGGDGETKFRVPPASNELVDFPLNMTSDNEPKPYVATSSGQSSGNPYNIWTEKGNIWQSVLDSTADRWLQIDFGKPKKIGGFKLKGPSGPTLYVQFPNKITFQGSNDGQAFETIQVFTVDIDYSKNQFSEFVDFTLNNIVNYRYYRFLMPYNTSTAHKEVVIWKGMFKIPLGTKYIKAIPVAGDYGVELTEEHLTGETYYGKPVYEKTWTTSSFNASPNTWTKVPISEKFFDIVLDGQIAVNGKNWYPIITSTSSDGGVEVIQTRNSSADNITKVRFKYTKTTD